MKGKALRRSLETSDALRINADVPLITDTTELITPDVAREMLKRNANNRPINWGRVEEYAETMRNGEWRLHAQGIVLDKENNILTGQKRLWAVVVSGQNVYMRVSRGNPSDTARLIDRGTPQTARDLASRDTERKHSPSEVSIARAYCALMGNAKPSADVIADNLTAHADSLAILMTGLKRVVKTKAVLMIAGAMLAEIDDRRLEGVVGLVPELAEKLCAALLPHRPEDCWNKGAAFGLGMERAKAVVRGVNA